MEELLILLQILCFSICFIMVINYSSKKQTSKHYLYLFIQIQIEPGQTFYLNKKKGKRNNKNNNAKIQCFSSIIVPEDHCL